MSLYQVIFEWFSNSIWANTNLDEFSFDIGGSSIDLDIWLCHTSTIIVLILLVVCCALFIRWIFKLVSGLILLK